MEEQARNKCYQIRVTGRVQGVGFRYHTRNKAIELGIHGFVRNETDGSVWIEADGDEQNTKEFISWCYHGPRFARVEQIEVTEIELKYYTDFRIR